MDLWRLWGGGGGERTRRTPPPLGPARAENIAEARIYVDTNGHNF